MSLRIVWLDDEAQITELGVDTLDAMGHAVKHLDNTHEFLEYLDEIKDANVDVFFLDMMMKIEAEDLKRLKGEELEPASIKQDTGYYIYKEIRKKFSDKPIVVLTIVRRPLPEEMREDKYLRCHHKEARIIPVLELAIELVGRG
ncbi:hypothetical protein KAR91_77070 [Candidatus Pacearchaeota archaeon]|nr:hypothetical protein [Candidatus Pacearchaeota archaeon]